MHETNVSFHNLESPVTGSTLPAGRHSLRGWLVPKPGENFIDVRGRTSSGGIFAGVHGLPRADLATFFKINRPYALAEFYIVVQLTRGPVEIIFEALDVAGRWREFTRATYQITPANPPVDFAVPSAPLRWHEFGRILEILLRAQRRRPEATLADLAHQVVASIPYPRDLRHAPAPFIGHLDEPAAVVRGGFGRAAVLGFLFHQTQPIKRVLATFDLQSWQTIEHGRPSPGPGDFYSQFPNARQGGLFGIIDVPAQIPDPVCLRLYAELADGSLHLCCVQRSVVTTNEDQKAPYPPKNLASFPNTLAALKAAMAERDMVVVEDDEFRREIGRLGKDYERRAPLSLPATAPMRPAPVVAASPFPRKVLLVTHNLGLEGAPLFFLDYARYLAQAGVNLTVLSHSTGPLRERFEQLGATVKIVDSGNVMAAPSAPVAREAIAHLGRQIDFAAFDLVVANTFTTFWAVHAAKLAKRPALMYVHESTTPASFYLGRVSPEVVALVEEAFGLADAVSFTTASTRNYHLDYGRPENHRLTPGWIDIARIDRWLTENPRDKIRNRFNLKPGELLVTNVGTFCERKGQHIFIRAVDLLWRRHPTLASRTQFVMLGSGETAFDESIRDLLQQVNRPNLIAHPATSDYFPYYASADLFVCSTYEESSPRVILEAMACGTPILSSDAQGVREQVRPDLEGTLVPPGDTFSLCESLAKLLLTPAIGRTQAARARERVVTEFDAVTVLPRHGALACELAAGKG
ncbi:MAG: glycosyltransferase family 4 protein [Lacunisphaera sp.]